MSSFLSELLEPEQAASDNPSAKVKTTNNHFFKMMSSFFSSQTRKPFCNWPRQSRICFTHPASNITHDVTLFIISYSYGIIQAVLENAFTIIRTLH